MKELKVDDLEVRIYDTRVQMGIAAAQAVGEKISEILKHQDSINIVFAAAPSQNEFLDSLSSRDIAWDRINAFHMDEYVGLDEKAPQLFGNYLKNKLFGKVNFREVYYIKGDTNDTEQECKRYSELLERYPTDIVILGIGENTHLAFNDPHVADFNDQQVVKVVRLDEKNRQQQVDPADNVCFKTIKEVPTHAITITIPALFKSRYAYAIVPGKNKADAIYHTLTSSIQERYPSTILRKHPHAILYIDQDSGSLI
ncbi:MAG: 6-phosphogluconolactonase [Chitinophagaceae bacterium]|nr:6-phosphogluconolactonase [Chitinophagaceae bacterium]MCZ2338482.1 6-phosphogluconolactonase [Chitinophagales bacterium]